MIFVGLAGLEMIGPVGEEPVWPAGAGAGGEVPHAVRPEREEHLGRKGHRASQLKWPSGSCQSSFRSWGANNRIYAGAFFGPSQGWRKQLLGHHSTHP